MSLLARSLVVCSPLLCPDSAAAQSVWLDVRGDATAGFEALRPILASTQGVSLTSGVLVLSARRLLRDGVVVEAEVPFARFAGDGAAPADHEFGNPYLGVEVLLRGTPLFLEVGARPPIVSSGNAAVIGLLSDLDRWEAFVDDLVPVGALANYEFRNASGSYARLRAGPVAWIGVGDRDTEVIGRFGVYAGIDRGTFDVGVGLSGFGVLTEGGSLGERTRWQATISGATAAGPVRPGVDVRFPVDRDLQNLLDAVIGVRLSIPFGGGDR